MSDVTFNIKENTMSVHDNKSEPWTVSLVDTGEETMTGGRLKRVKSYLKNESEFCFTYGDGVSDVNITNLIKHHKNHGNKATLTAVKPQGRFGALSIGPDNFINKFEEKPEGDNGWINGGFFVLDPSVIDLIDGDSTSWENEPLVSLASDGELSAFIHDGFWQPMDTLREKNELESLWASGKAPWKVW
jgi:glucose-1-phosphate cytidylyltransferase